MRPTGPAMLPATFAPASPKQEILGPTARSCAVPAEKLVFRPPPPLPPPKMVHVRELADVDFEQTKPRALVTLVSGCAGKKLWFHSRPSFVAAAERWGCDLVILQPSGAPHVFAEKFRVGLMLDGERWDRVAYVDADCLIAADAPSPFDLVPADRMGLLPERHLYARQPAPLWFDRETEAMLRALDLPTDQRPGEAYNAGVYVASVCHAPLIAPPPAPVPQTHCWEQNWMNWLLWKNDAHVFRLAERWNYMYWPRAQEFLAGEARANILHFAGIPNPDHRLKMMKEYAGTPEISSCSDVRI